MDIVAPATWPGELAAIYKTGGGNSLKCLPFETQKLLLKIWELITIVRTHVFEVIRKMLEAETKKHLILQVKVGLKKKMPGRGDPPDQAARLSAT